MHITTHWWMTRRMTDGQHNRTMKGATTSTSEGTSNGNGGGLRRNTSRGPGMFFLFPFFIFLTTTYSTMHTTTIKPAWLLLCRMAKLYQTQTTADVAVVLHAGIFTLCLCFFQLDNILIFSSERRSTKADPSQQKYMHAYKGPWKPTQTHESQRRPTRTHESQCRPMKVNTGQK